MAGGDIYGLIEAVDYLLLNSDEETQFIPGHGMLTAKKGVQEYRDTLAGLLKIVEELTTAGEETDEIVKQVKQQMDYQHYSGDDFIRQIHRSVIKKMKNIFQ